MSLLERHNKYANIYKLLLCNDGMASLHNLLAHEANMFDSDKISANELAGLVAGVRPNMVPAEPVTSSHHNTHCGPLSGFLLADNYQVEYHLSRNGRCPMKVRISETQKQNRNGSGSRDMISDITLRFSDGGLVRVEYRIGGVNTGEMAYQYETSDVDTCPLSHEILNYVGHCYRQVIDQMPDDVRNHFSSKEGSSSSLEDELVAAGIPEEHIPVLMEDVARRIGGHNFELVTAETFSDCVFRTRTEIGDELYPLFGKVGSSVLFHHQVLDNVIARQYELLRVPNPKVHKLIDIPDTDKSLLLTHDTADSRITPSKTVLKYLKVRRSAFEELSKRVGWKAIKSDPYLAIDCFNLALRHTYMRGHRNDPRFASSLTLMEPADTLEFILHLEKKGELDGLPAQTLIAAYRAVQDEVTSYNSSPTVLATGDLKDENIFPDPFGGGLRVVGDSTPRPATEVFDMSRRNLTPNQCIRAMSYISIMRNYLEQRAGRDFEFSGADIHGQQSQLAKQTLVQSIFLADYYARVGRMGDCLTNLSNATLFVDRNNAGDGYISYIDQSS